MAKKAQTHQALIIASYQYQDDSLQKLVAPAQDAEALARVLEDAAIGGFETKVLVNCPSHQVRFEIEAFLSRRKRSDLLLLYFSGHGIKDDDGRLYLATTDTRRKTPCATAIPASFVRTTTTPRNRNTNNGFPVVAAHSSHKPDRRGAGTAPCVPFARNVARLLACSEFVEGLGDRGFERKHGCPWKCAGDLVPGRALVTSAGYFICDGYRGLPGGPGLH